jgi:hypothetical protein
MAKMKLAKDEYDKVADNLSHKVKMNRLRRLYDADEVLTVLGYHDEGMDLGDVDYVDSLPIGSREWENAVFSLGAINGNFEQAIKMNKYLPV